MDDSDEIDDTKPKTAICLWCGAPRPVDVAICPTCEHAWIDATIEEVREGKLETMAASTPALPERQPWWRRKWLPVAVAAVAALTYGIVFWVMWDDTQPDPVAATTTVPVTTAAPTTSAPVASTTSSTTTSTTTTTTTSTTTTTTLPPIPEVLPALDPDTLTLGAFALGPLRLSSSGPNAAGRLVATFGQPDAQFPVGENWGLCPTETGRALRWGDLSIILRQEPDTETLVGYRLDESGEDSPTASLRSLSGLGLGDPLSRVRVLYAVVETSTLDDGTPIFIVLRSSDRRTLLWGALTDDADPTVASINSRRPCDGGPFES